MTEEVNSQGPMEADQEEGEILEDGEIADDEDDIVAIGQHSPGHGATTKDEKENKESNQSKMGTMGSFSSYYPIDRDDHFKPHKRKKKNNSKKRKRSNSNEAKRKQVDSIPVNQNTVDISHCFNDTTFDTVELSDEDDYNFDQLEFDVLMEILGCTAGKALIDSVPAIQKKKVMLRIIKIMKQLHGNDPDTNRRFARLKRRTKERQNSNSNPGPNSKSVYKAICKFYLEGKCHKGADCYFSHDCVVPKRKDLCKFYLQGFCGKGDDCLFMHGEFPCKFFHTNTECYSGENCRFSHAPLTEDMREVLRNYLDSGTLPDDPKPPFRSHYSDWSSNANNKNFDPNEVDSAEFDSSFNYETEQLLSRPRPVILGDPTPKVKTSYNTWTWQQELKELEKAYTGLKKNLFCIDAAFAITEKPPTPRIEDDEDEVEAQIMNYYSDILDTDEMDEMLAMQEIEEHQRKVREEDERAKGNENIVDTQAINKVEELSEEEKRLIEASAHDEDLRILPGAIGSAFLNPPAINPVFDQISYAPSSNNNYFPPSDNFAAPNPFNIIDTNLNSLPLEATPKAEPNFPDVGAPFVAPSQPPELTAADVNSMVRQIRNGILPEPVSVTASPPSKPEYRDPRLARLKDSGRSQNNLPTGTSQPAVAIQVEEKPINKPFIKVCNPNVIVDYKLVLMKISSINYSCYLELYLNDNALKNDPRLKNFFSSNNADQKSSTNDGVDFVFSKTKNDAENLITLPPVSLPPIKTAATITPVVPSKVLSPHEIISAQVKNESESSTSPSLSRDPRIRSKETGRRRNSDPKVEEGSKSPPIDEKPITVVQTISENGSSLTNNESTNGQDTVKENANEDNSSSTTVNGMPSIPAYAMAALASTGTLYSATTNNLFANLSSTDKLSNNQTSLLTSDTKSSDDVIDNDSQDSGKLEMVEDDEEHNALKMDIEAVQEEDITPTNNTGTEDDDLPKWPMMSTNITSSSIDSDNEMEIDLQHHNESEVDSENENELIIASSSEPEPEDKDCDTATSEPVTLNNNDYSSVNC